MYCYFENLPFELYSFIQCYLTQLDYLQLMNSSEGLFQQIKFETIIYTFSLRESRNRNVTPDNTSGLMKLIEKVKDKSKQIYIIMHHISSRNVFNYKHLFEGIFCVSINRIRRNISDELLDCTVFNNVKRVIIHDDLTNVKYIPNTRDVQLHTISCGFENIIRLELYDIADLRSITNINQSKALQYLSIIRCSRLSTLNVLLDNVKIIHLECQSLSHLVGLSKSIEKLTLITSMMLSNGTLQALNLVVPTLKYLNLQCGFTAHQTLNDFCSPTFDGRTLILRRYNVLPTINNFPNLIKLDLNDCNHLIYFPIISSLRELKIYHCLELISIPTLPNLTKLEINNCRRLQALPSSQPSLKSVEINGIPLLKEISFSSAYIDSLSLYRCHAITDLSSLRNIPNLFIGHCDGVRSVQGLGGSSVEECRKSVELSSLKYLRNLSGLHHIDSLKLCDLSLLNFRGIDNIKYLEISRCNISNTEHLSRILCSITLQACPVLRRLDNLAGIPKVNLLGCPAISSFSGLKDHEEVRILLKPEKQEELISLKEELNIKKLIVE